MPLDVLLVTPDFPPGRGGIQLLMHRLVEHATPDVRMRVVTIGQPGDAAIDGPLQVPVHRVAPVPGPRAATLVKLNAAAARIGRAHPPDAVLCGHIVVSPAARAIGAPTVLYAYAKELGARPRLATWALQSATRTIVISTHTERLVRDLGAPAERLRLVPPGVDLPPADAPAPAPEPGLIVCVARLEDRYKGIDVIIRALPLVRQRVPAARLVVVGDGALRDWLHGLSVANGTAGRVEFAGSVPDDERDRWLARASVFAMPSRLPADGRGGEGFGIVYLEASARGVPVIAGAVGGATDAVDAGGTGLLVDPTDHLAVADALIRILADPAEGARLGAAGPAWAARFAWPQITERVEAVLAEAAREGSPGRRRPRTRS